MLLRRIILFINILIGKEIRIKARTSHSRGKHIYYRFENKTNYIDSESNFTTFTTDSSVLIDMGVTHYINATLIETENVVPNTTKMGLDLLGNSPHGTPTASCIASVAVNIVSFCMGYSRFIRIRVLQPLTIKLFEMKAHVTDSELFLGCYEYEGESTDIESDLDRCLFKCFASQRPYGGIMSGICHCLGDLFALKQVVHGFCYSPCTFMGQLCGNRPHIPIYFTDYEKLEKDTFIKPSCLENATKCEECPLGFGGISCNIRNCSIDNGGCQEDGCQTISETTIQTGVCQCREGFLPVFLEACNDIDECQRNPCWAGAICINILGSYKCNCRVGFMEIEKKCEDINECLNNIGGCQRNTTICSNTVGSYECKCLSGFEIADSFSCSDIDECATDNLCHKESTECMNSFGSYGCNCLVGYEEQTNYLCKDIDECLTNTDRCDDQTSRCHNTQGSYDCICLTGFMEVARLICEDIEECLSMQHNCSSGSTRCRNTVGSYECWCLAGLTKISAFSCTDVDECFNSHSNLCDEKSTICHNIWGSYNCRCFTGYESFNQYKCRDINECKSGLHSCEKSSICINSPGSFDCFCGPGLMTEIYNYITICEDINECKGTNLCSLETSLCVNYHGGYSCQCKDGYKNEDAFTCALVGATNATTTYIDDDYTTETRVSYEEELFLRLIIYLAIVAFGFLILTALCLINYLLSRFPRRESSGSASSLGSV